MPGRPLGSLKTGGRVKGTPNRATLLKMQDLKTAAMSLVAGMSPEERAKILPRDVLLKIMRQAFEVGNVPLAMSAAKECAPYFHPKLANTELHATLRRAPSDFTDQELLALAGRSEAQDLVEDESGVFVP